MQDEVDIKALALDHYTNLNLAHNPFSYLDDAEALLITEPRIPLETLTEQIQTSSSCFVELIGGKGLGKSTHLQCLYYRYFPEADFIKLKKKKRLSVARTSKILFIDSFQLLSLRNRVQLLNGQQKIIIAAHYSHRHLRLKRRELSKSFNFNDLSLGLELLEQIVTNKTKLARINSSDPVPKIKSAYLQELLKKYPKNIRAIERELYQDFIELKKDFYEL